MSGSDIPAYLRSLEAILGGSGSSAATPAPAPQPAPQPVPAQAPGQVLTLSSIGFGSMFAGSGSAATGASGAPDTDKLRFLMVSTHVQQFTGYSKISHGILTELAKQPWLQTTHFGFQRLHDLPSTYRPLPSNIEVIDAATLEKPIQQGFGFNALPDVIRRKKPHVVMIYNDLAVVTQFVEAIRKSGIPRNFQLWVYCDQVYTTQNQQFLDMLNRDADRVFAFSPFWRKCLKDQGITRPVDVLLHGFNPKQYFPVQKTLARRQVAIPDDVFLFLNVNRNQPRKRHDILIMAFVELILKYPTKPILLLCICDRGEKGGWWLFELFQRELQLRGASVEQFGNRLIVTAQNMSFKDEEINVFYNAADVGITTADGEGWGLCQFEQMGVGVPQVVPDIGGFKEFCSAENSVLVKPTVRYYHPTAHCPVGGEAMACTPHDVCLAMEEYLLNTEKKVAHGAAAREKVLSYTWERAVEPLLKRLRAVKEEGDD